MTELLVLDSNTWTHLTLCKEMIIYQVKLLGLDNNTWNHLTLCKEMINFKYMF